MTPPLEIDYPCSWSYRIFGEDEALIRTIVDSLLPEGSYSLVLSNRSKEGKYLSLNLETEVVSREQRDQLFRNLACSNGIKMVL